jgi:hypothetical protein
LSRDRTIKLENYVIDDDITIIIQLIHFLFICMQTQKPKGNYNNNNSNNNNSIRVDLLENLTAQWPITMLARVH